MPDFSLIEKLKSSVKEHNACEAWNLWVKQNPFFDLDLQEADLKGLSLLGVDLSRAFLSGADLSFSDLRGANLRGTDLEKVHLKETKLDGADLSYAYLVGYENLEMEELSIKQLIRCKSLKEIRGLSDEFMKALAQANPELMRWYY
jgi:uncharacterized protein YjbI with pentapeptide repeats